MQHPLGLACKLLVQKSVKAGRDLVYEFANLCQESITNQYLKDSDQKKASPSSLADIHDVAVLIDFLNASLRRVRHLRSSQILLFQTRNLAS